MTITPFKATLLSVGVSGIGVGSYGIYYLSSSFEETIEDRLKAKFRDSSTTFLHSEHAEWSNLGTWYSKVKNKPRKNDGLNLTLDEVKSWCASSVKRKFQSEEDVLYQQVEELCWLNVNTLMKELGKSGLRSSQNSDHDDWKVAWRSYYQDINKEGKGTKVEDAVLNGSDEVAGGKAMHKWCNDSSSKKMYDSESLLLAFRTWCVN